MKRQKLLLVGLTIQLFGIGQAYAYEIVTKDSATKENLCHIDGACVWPETSSVCPSDCGTIGIEKYTNQTAKYIDQTCSFNGDGSSDVCATSNGGQGKFNELQSALDSLTAGDTLYVYPGNYWRDGRPGYWEASNKTMGIYEVEASGEEGNPIIITAYDQLHPPVFQSFGPGGIADRIANSNAAIASTYGTHHLIFDHLFIDGAILLTGHHNIVQFTEGVRGWGDCPSDGNWSVFVMKSCDNCVTHHSYAHDIEGFKGQCPAYDDRGAAFKEFTSNHAIWEFNTSRDSTYYTVDMHRGSQNSTLRFSVLEKSSNAWSPIHFGDDHRNAYVYGNIIIQEPGGSECVQTQHNGGDAFHFYNNLCLFSDSGFGLNNTTEFHNKKVIDNIFHAMSSQNMIMENNANNSLDYNIYTPGAIYSRSRWDGPNYYSLSDWQSVTPFDDHSQETTCDFIDTPTNVDDFTYNLDIETGACMTASSTGGKVGPYGLVSCVGHTCDDVDGSNPDQDADLLTEYSYAVLNPKLTSVSVISLADHNTISVGNWRQELSLYEHIEIDSTIGATIGSGTIISGSGPFDVSSRISGTDMPAHASMLGQTFAMPHAREDHTYYMISPEGDASAELTVAGVSHPIPLPKGEVVSFPAGNHNGKVAAIITSDHPILVAHRAMASYGAIDASPIPPAALKLWGVCSGNATVAAVEDDTQISIATSLSAATRSLTLNAGERATVCTRTASEDFSQGKGPAARIFANKPISAVQIADGDGSDQTAFYPASLLNTRFGIPEDTQYIAVACPALGSSTGTSITLHHTDGSSETKNCRYSSRRTPGKAYFGNPDVNGAHILQGSYLESTAPVYVMYEVARSNDEHNLMGAGSN